MRRKTRPILVVGKNGGDVAIGGDAPIAIQTMVSVKESAEIIAQIRRCADVGADLIRVAIPNADFLPTFAEIVGTSPLPIIADIHFDWRLAAAAIAIGAAKIRINPGNIGDWDGLEKVARDAAVKKIPIRIGVNGGSIKPTNDQRSLTDALVEESLIYAERFEKFGCRDLVLSMKSSSVAETLAVNRAVAARCDYPLHLGVTEAGLPEDALLKTAIAVGALLLDGIGDTVRVSFTGEPEDEIIAAKKILRAVGLRRDRIELIACPTCGRTRQTNLIAMAKDLRTALDKIISPPPITVALMGCEVNGPGEARAADLGLAAAADGFWLFVRGEKIRHLAADRAIPEILNAITALPCPSEIKN